MSADIVNMMMYLEHGKPFPKKLNVKGTVSAKSMIGYKTYTGRDDAKKNNSESEMEELDGGYLSYTSRATAKPDQDVKRTISHLGWLDTPEKENQFRHEIQKHFNKDGDFAWVPVTSFKDYITAEQYGLFSDEDYAAIASKTLPQFFKKVGFKEDNMMWWMDFHSNKAHPHVHFAFLEKEKTRTKPTFTGGELNYFKGLIFKEALARERLLSNTAMVDLDHFKEKDLLYKEVRTNAIMLLQDRDNKVVTNDIVALYRKLPGTSDTNKRLQYNSSHMIPFRDEINKIIEKILNGTECKDLYDDFVAKCDFLDQKKTDAMTTVYHSIRDAEVKRLYSFLGNQILKGKKDFIISDISSDDLPQLYELDELITSDEIDEIEHYGFVDETEDYSFVELDTSFKSHNYWSTNYKQAKKMMYSNNPDYDQIEKLLLQEIEEGNPMAMYDLATLIKKELVISDKDYNALFEQSLKTFEAVADAGLRKQNNYFYYRIGKMYQYGQGTEINIDKAIENFDKTIGNKYAEFSKANILNFKADKTAEETEEAFRLYIEASHKDMPFASYRAAEMLRHNQVSYRDNALMTQLYKKTFDSLKGEVEKSEYVNMILGDMAAKGLGYEKDPEEALDYYLSADKLGSDTAAYKIAELLSSDTTLDHDDEMINSYYKKAYDQLSKQEEISENSNTEFRLAKMVYKGQGVNQDIREAIIFLNRSIKNGHPTAGNYLANIYQDIGDHEKAIEVLVECASAGNHNACYKIAKEYYEGEHIDQDIDKAKEYSQQAIKLNNPHAKLFLSKVNIETGDTEEGLKLLDECIDEKDDRAMLRKGVYQIKGQYCSKDTAEGLENIKAAADAGNEFAKEILKNWNSKKYKQYSNEAKRIQKRDGQYSIGHGVILSAVSHLARASEAINYDIQKELDEYYRNEGEHL